MNIIGFSEGFHDAAICRIKNGNILHASHSERYSKVKNDKWLHQKQLEVNGCLGLKKSIIAYHEKTWYKNNKSLIDKREGGSFGFSGSCFFPRILINFLIISSFISSIFFIS